MMDVGPVGDRETLLRLCLYPFPFRFHFVFYVSSAVGAKQSRQIGMRASELSKLGYEKERTRKRENKREAGKPKEL